MRIRSRQNGGAPEGSAPSAVATQPGPPPRTTNADGFPNHKIYDFWQYQNLLTPEQWKQCIGYAYRTHPAVVLGSTQYLFKFVEPVTMDYFKEKHGGGGYKIMFNRNGTTLFVEKFAIEGEPKLTDAEKAGKVPSAAEAATEKNNEALVSLLRDTLDRLQSGQDSNMVKASLAQALDLQAVGFKSALDAVTSVSKNAETGETKLLFAMMTTMMEKMMTVALTPKTEKDPLEKIESVLAIIGALRDEAGGPRRSGSWADKLVDKINPDTALARIADIARNIAIARSGAVAPGINPATVPTAAATPGAPPSASAPVDPSQVIPPPASEQRTKAEFELKRMVATMLLQGRPGDAAAAAADGLGLHLGVPDFGEKLAATLEAANANASGPEAQSLVADPVFSQILSHPQLGEFCAEFIAYYKEEPKEASVTK